MSLASVSSGIVAGVELPARSGGSWCELGSSGKGGKSYRIRRALRQALMAQIQLCLLVSPLSRQGWESWLSLQQRFGASSAPSSVSLQSSA